MATLQALDPLAILSFKNSLEQQKLDRERQAAMDEQRRKYRGLEEFQTATQIAQSNPDLLEYALHNMNNMSFGQAQAAQTLAKQSKKKLKATEGAALAPQANQAAQGTPIQKTAVQGQIAPNANNPDFLNSLAAAMQTQKQLESQQASGTLPEQRGEMALFAERAKISSRIDEARSIRAEGRSTRSQLVNELTNVVSESLAAESQGILEENVVSELYDRIPNLIADGSITKKDAKHIFDVGKLKATARWAEERRNMKLPPGETVATRRQEVIAKHLNDPSSLTNEDWAIALDPSAKLAFLDPAKGNKPLFMPNAPNAFIDSRGRLAAMKVEIANLRRHAESVIEDVQAGKASAGGVLGTDIVQRLQRLGGTQAGSVSSFMLAQQALLIDTARLGQDARLSDFDLLLWRAVIPGLIDLVPGQDGGLSDQALGRFAAINELVELQTEIPYSPRLRDKAIERADQIRTQLLQDPEIQRRSQILDKYMEYNKEGNLVFIEGGAAKAVREINTGKGGVPVSGVPIPALDQKNQALFDELNGR